MSRSSSTAPSKSGRHAGRLRTAPSDLQAALAMLASAMLLLIPAGCSSSLEGPAEGVGPAADTRDGVPAVFGTDGGGSATVKSAIDAASDMEAAADLGTAIGGDLNGYEAQYEIHLEIPTPPGSPSCEGASAELGDGAYIIRDDDGWNEIDNASYSQFFVCPRDYRAKGRLTFTRGGSSNSRRYIVGYDPQWDSGDRLWKLRSVPLVDNVIIDSADWLVIDRIKFMPKGPNSHGGALIFAKDSEADHNVLNRIEVDCDNTSYTRPMGVMTRCISFHFHNDQNTLQNSYVHDCKEVANADKHLIDVRNETYGTRFVNNEVKNCKFFKGVSPSGWMIVENNDFYMDREMYLQCNSRDKEWPAARDPDGHCMCEEALFTLKSCSGVAAETTRIIHNRFWGARQQGRTKGGFCGGTGALVGTAVAITENCANTIISGNIVGDSKRAFNPNRNTGSQLNVSVRNNLVHDVFNSPDYEDSTPAAFHRWQGTRHLVSFNTVVNAPIWLGGSGGDLSYQCNLVVDGGKATASRPAGPLKLNAYVGDSEDIGEPDAEHYSLAEAGLQRFCYWRRLQTGPEKVCVPNALLSSSSPLRGTCADYEKPAGYGASSDSYAADTPGFDPTHRPPGD